MTEIVSLNEVLKGNDKNFGAYAIILQGTKATYPNALKTTLQEIADKTDVKFLIAKITKVCKIN